LSSVFFGYLGHGNPGDDILLSNAIHDSSPGRCYVFLNDSIYPSLPNEIYRIKEVVFIKGWLCLLIAILRSNQVVCTGGTCFHNNKSGFYRIQLLCAVLRKKIIWRNVGFEQTFSPTKIQVTIFNYTLSTITVRDFISREVCKNIFNVDAEVRSDAVFIDEKEYTFLCREYSVVSVRNASSVKDVISQGIDQLIKNKYVYIVKCVTSDDEAISSLIGALNNKDSGLNIFVVDRGLQYVSGLIAHSSFFIGERMHLQIIADINGVPLVKIQYMEKCKNVVRIE